MREANVEASRSGQPVRRTSSYAFRQEVGEGVLALISDLEQHHGHTFVTVVKTAATHGHVETLPLSCF